MVSVRVCEELVLVVDNVNEVCVDDVEELIEVSKLNVVVVVE